MKIYEKLWQTIFHDSDSLINLYLFTHSRSGPYAGSFCQRGKRAEGPYIFKYEATFILPYIFKVK